MRKYLLSCFLFSVCFVAVAKKPIVPLVPEGFSNEQKVTIVGYDGNAQEPFISKDEKYLFFNSLNPELEPNTSDIFYAEKIDDLTFEFKGEVQGVNSEFVDATPTMDSNNNFYFVSTRDLQNLETTYVGTFSNGVVSNVKKVNGTINLPNDGAWLNMGVKISGDGNTITVSNADFANFAENGYPTASDIRFAKKENDVFNIPENEADILQNINTDEFLEYAGDFSEDGLELFFSRLDLSSFPFRFKLCHAKRRNTRKPFETPTYIDIPFEEDEFVLVEAPTLSADGKRLYYHKRVDGISSVYMLTR